MVTNLSSYFGSGALFACKKWPKMDNYWGKCSQMCQVMCVMSGDGSAAQWAVLGTAAGKPVTGDLSRESSLEEWTCEGVGSGVVTWHVTRRDNPRDNVLFDSPEVTDLHRGSPRCWPSELYLRPRNAESEKRRLWKMLPDSSARVPGCWRRPGLCRILSSSIQQPGGAARVATGKVRWEATSSHC